jgi:preprotein translocase subunit SecY
MKIILFILKPRILYKLIKYVVKKIITFLLKPSIIFGLLVYIVSLLGFGNFSESVTFNETDDESDNINKDKNPEAEDKGKGKSTDQDDVPVTNYDNKGK